MSLRTRIALAAATAVAVAVVLAAFASYAATARSLRNEIDASLARTVRELPPGQGLGLDGRGERFRRGEPFGGARPGRLGGAGAFAQLIDANGDVVRFPPGGEPLPVPDGAGEVAAGEGARYATVESDGTSVRVLVAPFVPGYAVEVGRPLDEVESTLDDLRRTLHPHRRVRHRARGAARPASSRPAACGRSRRWRRTSSTSRAPTTSATASRCTATTRPRGWPASSTSCWPVWSRRRNAQDQLVADASHELRTPLTALRANVELLALDIDLDPDERRRLAADLSVQLDQFGRLVAGARGAGARRAPAGAARDAAAGRARGRRRGPRPRARADARRSRSRPSRRPSSAIATRSSAPSPTCSTTPSSTAARTRRSR